MDEPTQGRFPAHLRFGVLTALSVVLLTICWLEHRSLDSLASRLERQSAALQQMGADTERIGFLSTAPKRVTDRSRPNDELLAVVESALRAAGIPLDRWQDSIPQPPQTVADSPYTRMTTRLYFQDTTLQQLSTFAHNLLESDPTLTISSLRLTAPRRAEHAEWSVELALAYLIYE